LVNNLWYNYFRHHLVAAAGAMTVVDARLLLAKGADGTMVWTTNGACHWCSLLLLPSSALALYIWFVFARGEDDGGATAFLLVMVVLLRLHRARDVYEGWRWCRFWLVSLLNAWRCAGFVAGGDGGSQWCRICVFRQVVEACSGGTTGLNMQGYSCCCETMATKTVPELWWLPWLVQELPARSMADGNMVKMGARVSGCVQMKMMTWQHTIGLNSLVETKPTWHVLVGQF